MNIVFTGMKHCGKTTHGRAFAAEHGRKFYDTDDMLIDSFNRANNCSLDIRGIFNTVGETEFMRLEEELMEKLLRLGSCNVISMGGRMPVNDNIQARLKQLGFVVYLKLPAPVLFERVRRRGLPSFIDPARPLESFSELYARREPYYLKGADLVIELDDMPPHESRQLIFSKIQEAVNGR